MEASDKAVQKTTLEKVKTFLSIPYYVLGVRRSAILEIFIFLAIVLSLDFISVDHSRFMDVSPHPFWIILLLICVQYGTNEALFCAAVISAVLLVGNLPEHLITETIYDYLFKVTYLPFLWIGTAVILGELRTRQIHEQQEYEKDLAQANKEKETITEAYYRLKVLKESLETRLASEMRSAISIYEAAKSLEGISQSKIIIAIEDIVVTAMGPKKFSVYAIGSDGFEPLVCYGWEDNDRYTRRFNTESVLYEQIVGRKRAVCVINETDERILSGEGVLAGPLIDTSSGKVFGMLKIEELGFMELNMSNIETFRVLCEWIGAAYSTAGKYQAAKDDSLVNYEHMLLSHNFFKRQSAFLVALANRLNFDLSMLAVRIANADTLSEKQQRDAARNLGKAVNASLRKVDQVFDGPDDKEKEFIILLPGTPVENTDIIITKIKDFLKTQKVLRAEGIKYSFSKQSLHKKDKAWKGFPQKPPSRK